MLPSCVMTTNNIIFFSRAASYWDIKMRTPGFTAARSLINVNYGYKDHQNKVINSESVVPQIKYDGSYPVPHLPATCRPKCLGTPLNTNTCSIYSKSEYVWTYCSNTPCTPYSSCYYDLNIQKYCRPTNNPCNFGGSGHPIFFNDF